MFVLYYSHIAKLPLSNKLIPGCYAVYTCNTVIYHNKGRYRYDCAFSALCGDNTPAVPLIGAEIYKRRNDNTRRSVCYVLFFLQLMLSACYVVEWFSR